MKCILLLFVLGFFPGVCLADDLQVVFATGEWAPFSSEILPEYGTATALVSAICKAGGIQPRYKFYPWKRAELKVVGGEIFAALPYAISKERKKIYDFSDTLFHGINVFVYYEKNLGGPVTKVYETIADLRGYRIGGISGSFLRPAFSHDGLNYEPTTTLDQSIHKLVAGRIDLCIDDKVVLYDAIMRLYPDKIEHFRFLPKPFGKKMENALLVSRTYPGAQEILSKFNKGLAIIKQNGEYDRIITKYNMSR
jgi:polar amino acid transport system substrate-binding protein